MHLLARFPLRWAHGLGGALGWLLGVLPTEQKHVSAINLARAFPELDARRRGRILRASTAALGRTFAELPALWIWDRERTLDLVKEVVGLEHVEAAVAAGRGVIHASPHLGSLQILMAWFSSRYPVTVVYRRPRYRELDELSRRGRERFGARLVPSSAAAVRTMLASLKAGEIVALAPDQDAGEGSGVFVPFFGELANTGVLLPRLAARTGARVIWTWNERLPRGEGFRLHFEPATQEVSDPDLECAARALNQGVEQIVRRTPEQYLWSYKRYRIRPPGSSDPYKARG
jgi:KDO2-lipid IV(A) lauroyltransferase